MQVAYCSTGDSSRADAAFQPVSNPEDHFQGKEKSVDVAPEPVMPSLTKCRAADRIARLELLVPAAVPSVLRLRLN